MWFFTKLLFGALFFGLLACIFVKNGSPLVNAQETIEDKMEGEEASVEDEGMDSAVLSDKTLEYEEGEEDTMTLKAHPDSDTQFLFIKPAKMGLELPAGSDVHFLVGFSNKGKKDFIIETMEASFRYAMDFSFHIQNFSAIQYYFLVKPQQETTLSYSLFISEAYSARPYGFTVNLFYRDSDGNQYVNAVFNETVSIIEIDEGLNGETLFLYVVLAALAILVLIGFQQLFVSLSRKRSGGKQRVEMGTSNINDVDYNWLPPSILQSLNKSPKAGKTSPKAGKASKSEKTSPKQSPGRRKAKRNSGSGDSN